MAKMSSFILVLLASTGNNYIINFIIKYENEEGGWQSPNENLQTSVLSENPKEFLERNHILAVLRGVVSLMRVGVGGGNPTELPLFMR